MKALQKRADMSLLDNSKTIDGDVAWSVAEMINDMDQEVQLAKGKFWNRCKHGTRQKICDHFGWAYGAMREYGRYANEMAAIAAKSEINYTTWRKANVAKIPQEERKQLFEKAAENNWNETKIRKEIDKKAKKHGDKSDATFVFKNGRLEKEEPESKKKKSAQPIPKASMAPYLALEVFGLYDGLGVKISEESLKALYRHYSRKYHPDNGGSAEQMAKLNEAYEIVKNHYLRK